VKGALDVLGAPAEVLAPGFRRRRAKLPDDRHGAAHDEQDHQPRGGPFARAFEAMPAAYRLPGTCGIDEDALGMGRALPALHRERLGQPGLHVRCDDCGGRRAWATCSARRCHLGEQAPRARFVDERTNQDEHRTPKELEAPRPDRATA